MLIKAQSQNKRGGFRIIVEGLYSIISTFVVMVLCARGLVNRSWRSTLVDRFGFGAWSNWRGQNEEILWFHGASVGEVAGLDAVVKRLGDKLNYRVLVTTTSSSGKTEVRRRALSVEPCLLPFDHPLIIGNLLRQLAPRLVVLSETELWPALIWALGKRGIPLVLINGRISDRTYPRYLKLRFLTRMLLGNFVEIVAQSELDRLRFIELGACPEHVRVGGSTKYDQPAHKFSESELGRLRDELGLTVDDHCFVAGSVRPGEDELVIKAFIDARVTLPNLSMIIAPRHPERFAAVEQLLQGAGIDYWSRSRGIAPGRQQVVLLDTLGELSQVYALASVAFVGGTLVAIGGHNPLEPAAYGKPIIVGPFTENVREAIALLKERDAVTIVRSAEELTELLIALSGDPLKLHALGDAAYRSWLQNHGATERVCASIEQILFENTRVAKQKVTPRLIVALSQLYDALQVLRNHAFDHHWVKVVRSELPVISIGNITTGGSGKSPLAHCLAEKLSSYQHRPVILSRGYGGSFSGPHLVSATDAPALVGDEAVMHRQALNGQGEVVVSRRRVAGAQFIATRQLGDIIILDDGFQHRWLYRDVDLVLVDASSDAQNLLDDKLLPAGHLREDPERALIRASAIILVAKGEDASQIDPTRWIPQWLLGSIPVLRFGLNPAYFQDVLTGEQLECRQLRSKKVAALCAIAKPGQFYSMLEGLGLILEQRHSYRDHHLFSSAEWGDLVRDYHGPFCVTQKDAAKLAAYVKEAGKLFALALTGSFASLEEEQTFWQICERNIPSLRLPADLKLMHG